MDMRHEGRCSLGRSQGCRHHVPAKAPSLEPRTLLSTSTSQRLARELEILVLDIKFKKNNVPMPIPFSKDAEVRLRICV